jgi:hypothetical protein
MARERVEGAREHTVKIGSVWISVSGQWAPGDEMEAVDA